MMKQLFIRCLGLLMVPLLLGTAYVDDFHRFGLGARGLALGQSQTAGQGDGYSFYWNPAGLGEMHDYSLTSMSYKTFGFVDNQFIGLTIPIGYHTAISGGVFQTSLDGIIETTVNGAETGDTFGYSGDASYLALGHRFTDDEGFLKGWSVGVTAKQLKQTLKDQVGSATAVDLGLHYDIQPGLRVGSVFQNIYQSGFSWDTGAEEDLPLISKLGVAYAMDMIHLSADYVSYSDRDAEFMAGVEWQNIRSEEFEFSWRAGYRSSAISLGLGLSLLGFDVDYVYLIQDSPVLDNQHLFSVNLSLGSLLPEEALSDEEYFFDTKYLALDESDEFGFDWVNYTDMENHPLKDTAERLKRIDLMPNVALFKPKVLITREYLAVNLVKFLELSPQDFANLPKITDAPKTMENYLEIATAVELNYMSTSLDGYFYPDRTVTRAEIIQSVMAALHESGLEIPESPSAPFKDIPSDPELNLAIRQAYAIGLVKASPYFYPNRSATVAELISILSRTPPVMEKLSIYLEY